MKKKLRLLVTQDCPRSCAGCCNKDFDLEKLPVVSHYDYDLIMVTGGEPLSSSCRSKTLALLNYLQKVDINPTRKVVVYTASHDYVTMFGLIKFDLVDGITLTLHTQDDLNKFVSSPIIDYFKLHNKSLRLNIFDEVVIPEGISFDGWEVKQGIKWIENCPLPADEIFMRTPTI